jgi:hypothetical protein
MTSSNELIRMALSLIDEAHAQGVECRLIGSLGIEYYVGAERFSTRPAPAKDIDVIAKRSSQRALQNLLARRGWRLDTSLLLLTEKRETYYLMETTISLDLYYDEIDGSHSVALKNRLAISYPVIPLIDLLLTKLQRQQLRPQDEWDICALLNLDVEQNSGVLYFSRLIGTEWSLFTTVTDNLDHCSKHGCRTQVLLAAALAAPKSVRWRIRAIIGRRVKWWNEIYSAPTGNN